MDKKPIIHLYTFCWNEMDILPFVIDYWKQYVTHAFVYEKGSTDGSREYLQQFDWITILDHPVDGLNDIAHMQIKNNCWKESRGKCDLVVVCDMDECLWSWDIDNALKKFIDGGYSHKRFTFYNLKGTSEPTYEEGKYLHEIIDKVQKCPNDKVLLFNPYKVQEINYTVGAHTCNPTGEINGYKDEDIIAIHINKGFGAEYQIKRFKELNRRLSDVNRRYGLGIHYTFSEQKLLNDYTRAVEESISMTDEIEKLKQQYSQKAQ